MQSTSAGHIEKIIKYGVVNSGTFLLDLSIVRAGYIAHLPLGYIAPLSFFITSIVSYFLLHLWVFHDHTSTHSRASLLFLGLVIVQGSLIGFGMRFMLMHSHLLPEVARTIVGLFTGALGYLVCHYIIFTKE